MPEANLPVVDCWRIDLDAPRPPESDHWIAAPEHTRAERFRFEHLQRRYRATRAGLRTLLARELHTSPADVRFVRSPRGKPSLDPIHQSTLHFNLTHSEHVAWVALGPQELGIDLEVLGRAVKTLDSLVHRITTPDELARLLAMPEALQELAFLLMWTRKESTLKAWGEGISSMGSLNTLDSQLPDVETLIAFLQQHHPDRLGPAMAAHKLAAPPRQPGDFSGREYHGPHPIPPALLTDHPEAHQLPQVLIHYPDVRLPTAEGERPPLYATTLDLGSELITVSSPTPFRARIHRFSY